MIQFNCPNCGRHYELARLACPGSRWYVGSAASDLRPRTAPRVRPPRHPPPNGLRLPRRHHLPCQLHQPPNNRSTRISSVSQPDSSPDIDFNIPGPTTASSLSDSENTRGMSLSEANTLPQTGGTQEVPGEPDTFGDLHLDPLPQAPAPSPPWRPQSTAPASERDEEKSEATILPFIADLVVFALLVVVGMLLGEVIVRKSTGDVLAELANPTFPPVDLVVWAVPTVVFAFIYILLGRRDRTVGAWIRNRALETLRVNGYRGSEASAAMDGRRLGPSEGRSDATLEFASARG